MTNALELVQARRLLDDRGGLNFEVGERGGVGEVSAMGAMLQPQGGLSSRLELRDENVSNV